MMNKRIVLLTCTSIFVLFTILSACAHAQSSQPPVADANGPYFGTEGVAIIFDGSGSYDPNGTTLHYFWDFGDGESSPEENPTHAYSQNGTYIVTLTVTNAASATGTDTTNATVADTHPTAEFSAIPITGAEPLQVGFTDLSASHDGILSWTWDFGDGETSNEQSPTHTYIEDGIYTVELTVHEEDGDSATETKVGCIVVSDAEPTADFSASPTSGSEPLQVSFTDLSTSYDGIVSWVWDFGHGEPSIDQNPTHAYTQEGVYTVILTVYEGDGDSATETKVGCIVVDDTEPAADFTASPTGGTEPLAVSFTDTSTSQDGIVSWAWDFNNDGIVDATKQDPIHSYAGAGLYTVSLTVSEADGDTDTETKFSYVIVDDSVPTASFTFTPSNPLEGDQVAFDASGSTGYDEPLAYSWDFGDSTTGEGVSPTHTYSQNGTYPITLTVTDADGSSNSTSQTITVTDTAPVADFSATPTSGLEPLQVSFIDLSTSEDGITSWTWDFGDGGKSTTQHPTHVYAVDGTYAVTLTVLDADGSSDKETKMQYVTVTDAVPIADFSYVSNPVALRIDFTDQSTSYDALVAWAWDFGDGETSQKQNPTHRFPDDGTFSVLLVVTDADGSTDSITKQVTVLNIAPSADFNIVSSERPTVNENITFMDHSSDPDGNLTSWFWDFGDGTPLLIIHATQNVTHRYQTIGTFVVNLTVEDDDGATDTIFKSIEIYDVVPPVTINDYDGLWHTSDFTINLTATDDFSGVLDTYYRINKGFNMSVRIDGQPLISTEGYNTLEYWSVDLAGNEETHQIRMDVKLDKTDPTVNAGPDQVVNEDTPMTFDGSASYDNIGIISYTWDFGDGNLTTAPTPKANHTYMTPGTYTVTLSVTDAALHSATDTIVITIIDTTPPVANAGDDLVVHEDTIVTFSGSDSTDNVEIVSYIWTFIDVEPRTLDGVNSAHIFEVPGVYNVTLTVSDAEGNFAADVVVITVIDATWPAADAGPDQVVEEDTLVSFDGSASSDNVGIITYIWTFMDGTLRTIFGVNPSYVFETPGAYTVTLNVTDIEGHFTTDTVLITVQDTTPPLIVVGDYAVIVENVPVNLDASGSHDNVAIIDYQWNFGDGAFENSTIPSVVHTYNRPGVYIVRLAIVDEAGNVDSTSISIVVSRDTDGDLIPDHTDPDDDNDEMPDEWEILHGLDPFDLSDASLDFDGDGFSNFIEYQINSNPHDFASPSPIPLVGVLVIAISGFAVISGVLFVRKLKG